MYMDLGLFDFQCWDDVVLHRAIWSMQSQLNYGGGLIQLRQNCFWLKYSTLTALDARNTKNTTARYKSTTFHPTHNYTITANVHLNIVMHNTMPKL